eukprot:2083497-Lingulodinium_polyedra.AAC.1
MPPRAVGPHAPWQRPTVHGSGRQGWPAQPPAIRARPSGRRDRRASPGRRARSRHPPAPA